MPTPPEQASVSEGPRPADVNLKEVPLCVPSQAVRTLILAASPVLHHTSLNLRALSSRFLLHPHPATSTRTLERGLHPRHCLDANTVKSGFLVRGPCALATSNGASHSHLSFPGLGFPKKCNAHGAVPALAAARLDAHCSLLTANRAVARLVLLDGAATDRRIASRTGTRAFTCRGCDDNNRHHHHEDNCDGHQARAGSLPSTKYEYGLNPRPARPLPATRCHYHGPEERLAAAAAALLSACPVRDEAQSPLTLVCSLPRHKNEPPSPPPKQARQTLPTA
ncbi:hypothetical protein Purlil1_5895 [Purpureocillium lilacinum]|uniref:Uncharacterized protein n=1 Tax=Purpureocillium lilacinum TaxID=33203 RepID=A0ABR0C0I2_PURLI|nr:hypothetical protein Purlil1_5895 [Purpureocillium lilacinum]